LTLQGNPIANESQTYAKLMPIQREIIRQKSKKWFLDSILSGVADECFLVKQRQWMKTKKAP
jgi:hypothetical protein